MWRFFSWTLGWKESKDGLWIDCGFLVLLACCEKKKKKKSLNTLYPFHYLVGLSSTIPEIFTATIVCWNCRFAGSSDKNHKIDSWQLVRIDLFFFLILSNQVGNYWVNFWNLGDVWYIYLKTYVYCLKTYMKIRVAGKNVWKYV